MYEPLKYIVVGFLVFFSSINHHKVLASNLIKKQNSHRLLRRQTAEPALTVGQLLNQRTIVDKTQKNIALWLKILQQDRDKLTPQELVVLKSKIAINYFKIGEYEEAASYWESTLELLRDSQEDELLAAKLSDLAKTYLNLGQTLLANRRLEEAIAIAKAKKLKPVLYSAYLTLSNINQIEGKYLAAEQNLQESLNYAVSREEKTVIYYNLSRVFQTQAQILSKTKTNINAEDFEVEAISERSATYQEKAWLKAQKAIDLSKNLESPATVDALLQMLKLGAEIDNFNRAPYLDRAEEIITKIPDSTHKVYSLVNLSEFKTTPVSLLTAAVTVAERIGDSHAASFALGRLGTYYEQTRQYDLALDWTNKAILAVSPTQTTQNLYQWYWQKGRIYNTLGNTKQAIEEYNRAIASLEIIRGELAKTSQGKIDFATRVEPVYRELLQLLLILPTPQQVERALEVKDLLQISELENYFGDDCSEFITESETLLDSKTASIHTLIFPQATHIILKQADRIPYHTKVDITQRELETLVRQWRYSLEDRTEENYLALSKQMYDLLIKPIESQLQEDRLEALIFVNDGILKNVPMAALYDGRQFLVENYTVTNSLNLNLQINENPTFTTDTKILAFGLSEETANFPALPYVEQEIQLISELVEVEGFLNSEFTPNIVEEELVNNNFRLIHFATHGEFGGTAEESFLSTYQGNISLSTLEEILNQNQLRFPQNPIDLLVLSACETAAGNDRAVLGLAGIAIRSGVVNVVGSLWSVNDRSAVYLVDYFYDRLFLDGLSPTEALRQTQIEMIRDSTTHPSIWSNLILIAN